MIFESYLPLERYINVILREVLISLVATRRVFFMVGKATVGVTVK